MDNQDLKKRKQQITAWGVTTGIIGAQGKLIQHFGGEMAKGFFTGFMPLLKSQNRMLLKNAPLPIKIGTGVMIGAGFLAKRPIEGMKSMYEVGRSKVNDFWKK